MTTSLGLVWMPGLLYFAAVPRARSVEVRVKPALSLLLRHLATEAAARARVLTLDVSLVPAMHGGVQDCSLGSADTSPNFIALMALRMINDRIGESWSGNGGDGMSLICAR
ncbi:MAG: hypothetical protein ACRDUV_17800 [Pseudonocardiaceae bacterium]